MNLKKLLTDNTYDFLRKSYITVFIIAVLTRVIMPIASHETQLVNTLVFSAVALFGAFTIVFDLFTKRIMLTQKNVIFLAIFLAICTVSSIINMKYGVFGNIRNLVWLSISFFLLYPVDKKRTKEDIKKEIKYVSNILITVWFGACSISLAMFLFQIGYYIDIFPDSFARQGFIEGRLFGIFEDPNFAAIVAIIVIIFSIFNIRNTKRKGLKIFYIVNIVINYFYIVLSGSRTAEVSAAVVTLISVYFILNKEYNNKDVKLIIKQVIVILISLICSAALFFSITVTRKALSYLPTFIGSPFETTSKSENYIKKPIDTTRDDINNSSDVSNCRFKIWISALELFKSKPIFGTSPRNMRTYAKAEFPNGFIAQRSYAVHNAYIDVLTSTGIAGALSIAIFFCKYLYDIFKYLFSKANKSNYYLVLLNFLIISAVAVSAVFLSEIFFVNTIGVLVFWLNLGYSYYFIEKDNKVKVDQVQVFN